MIYRFDAFELDTDRHELRRDGEAVAIEPQVFALLAFLVSNANRMVSKDEISEHVWGGRIVTESALSSRIKSVRQCLGDDGKTQRYVRTVHGQGFRFVGDLSADDGLLDDPAANDAGPGNGGADPASSDRPAIAVLPFSNLSGEADQEYFSDGITEDIIAALARHRWLRVIARNTAFGYKGRDMDARRLADELGARYLVEGSVRRAGNRIRVAVQLIDTATGNHLWVDRYDRDLEDIFEVQDTITETIAARIEPEIGAAERRRVVRAVRRDLQAWDCYHLGVWHFFKFTAEDNLEAQRLLQQSRDMDPEFGEAHAWWAYATILGMVYWDTEPDQERLDAALAATNRALQIDDRNAVFYALKARVQLARREYDSALAENEIAISLNPTFAAAHCGLGDSLAYEGRYDDALKRFEKAIDLSPNDPQRWAFLTYGALALIFRGDYETAIDWADRAREIPNCQYWTIAHKAVALAHLERQQDARRVAADLIADRPDFSVRFARRKLFYLKKPEQLQLYLDGLALAGVPD